MAIGTGMKAGTETGSLVNHLYSGMNSAAPEVGKGCTILSWTDRHPATIVRVISAKAFEIQEDDAKRIDKNGMSESQKYEYTPRPEAGVQLVKLTKKGWQLASKQHVVIGRREKYHDFSF